MSAHKLDAAAGAVDSHAPVFLDLDYPAPIDVGVEAAGGIRLHDPIAY